MTTQQTRREIERILERHCSDWSLRQGKKHYRVTIRRGERHRTIPAPITPSCARALRNWETRLKHTLADLKQVKQ